MKIILFSGPIESGKSTALRYWSHGRPHVRGILMPGACGQRQFLDIATGAAWGATAPPNDNNPLYVGRYAFSRTALARAVGVLEGAAREGGGWLLIDEIGKLELRGEGFDGVLRGVLSGQGPGPEALLLVVRAPLLEAVVAAYGLQEARVLHDLSTLPPPLPNS